MFIGAILVIARLRANTRFAPTKNVILNANWNKQAKTPPYSIAGPGRFFVERGPT